MKTIPRQVRRGLLIWAVVFTAGCVSPRSASGQTLFVTAAGSWEQFENGTDPWNSFATGLGVDGSSFDMFLELSRSARYGRSETRVLADAWRVFNRHLFGNLRVHMTPDAQVHPGSDVLAELYFSTDGGLEPSVQVRRMAFSESEAWIGATSLGVYRGSWYLRAQALVTDGDGGSVAASLLARRYDRQRDYLQARLDVGRQVVQLAGAFAAGTGVSVGLGAEHRLASGIRLDPRILVAHDQVLGSRITAGLTVRVGG